MDHLVNIGCPLNNLVYRSSDAQITFSGQLRLYAFKIQYNLCWVRAGGNDKIIFYRPVMAIDGQIYAFINIMLYHFFIYTYISGPPAGLITQEIIMVIRFSS